MMTQLREENAPLVALANLRDTVKNIFSFVELAGVEQACLDVLNNPDFIKVPASVSRHHAYDGGLVVHVNEVWQFASALARHSGANIHILLAATIYHDLMKIRELVKDGLTWKHTDYKDKIFHVAGSFAVWEVQCTLRGIDKDFKDQVSHCLLSHHGRIEWGAAREPQTKEAYILHVADMISYQFGAGAR